jgi:hypothetical protein
VPCRLDVDATLSPEWVHRVYSYTADWGDGAAATEIRDGSGNVCFIVYTLDGAFIKGANTLTPTGTPAQSITQDCKIGSTQTAHTRCSVC